MDDQRLERELRVGLADLLDPVVGSHPRWAASPAAERVAGMPARGGLSGRFGLLWAAALLALLLVALLAAAVFVGSRRSDLGLVIAPSPAATAVAGPIAAGELVDMTAVPVQIKDLAFAPDGTAWAATGLGVVHWDPAGGAATLYDRDDGLPGQEVDLIEVGADRTILVSGRDRMATFDGTWTVAPDLGGVYGLAVGPDGTAWALDSSSLLRHDGSWSRIGLPESLASIGPLVAAGDGSVWATAAPSGTMTEPPSSAGSSGRAAPAPPATSPAVARR